MTIHTSRTVRIARYIALPIVSAGIIGGAAVGMASMANAATPESATNTSYSAPVQAQPAPNAQPGHRWHTGVHHIPTLQPTSVQ
jgi:hypothetical protein